MLLSNSSLMRDADAEAIHALGIPSQALMLAAAEHVAAAATELLPAGGLAVAVCGSGNNGGDGVAAAGLLIKRGFRVRALLVGRREKLTHDTADMERRLVSLGGALEDFHEDTAGDILSGADVIIDALFGIGLSRELRGGALRAVELMNSAPAPVVAADIPSGVDADTGRIMGAAVSAAVTVTFSMAKPGHFLEPGCVKSGELRVRDIGIPAAALQGAGSGVYAITRADAALPGKNPLSHKGDNGRLLIVAGSEGYTGAPSLCAGAAVRSGAGLVYLGVPSAIYDITAVKNTEAMPFRLSCGGDGRLDMAALPVISERLALCDVGVIGPGLGRNGDIQTIVRTLARESGKPLLLDADALWALSGDVDALKDAPAPRVLTPHEGEFCRLLGRDMGPDRLGEARAFAAEYNCALILKGHRSVCALPDGTAYISTVGNAGMATGGTGDVLSGVLGALMGQLPLDTALTRSLWLHGRAGDMAREAFGEYSMKAGDITDALPRAFMEIIK